MDIGFLERAGVAPETFTALVSAGNDDEALLRHFDQHVPAERRDAANRWILKDKSRSLDRQDEEEGRKLKPSLIKRVLRLS